jgi:glycosyltransferase involved in cell wall biosynthesis
MDSNDREIWITVDETDSQFVREEVLFYCFIFDKVRLFSKKKLNIQGLESDNLETILLKPAYRRSDYLNPFLIAIYFKDLLSYGTSWAYVKRGRYNLSLFVSAIAYARAMKLHLASTHNKKVYIFSYWFADWALALAWLKYTGIIKGFCTRAHGRDVFEDREPVTQKLPFRKFVLQQCDAVFSVSQAGQKYLQHRYGAFRDKIHTLYLGTRDHGIGKFGQAEPFTIVTCARVRNVKRIHLVPQILARMKTPVRWVHFGDENLTATNDPTIPLYREGKEMLKQYAGVQVVTTGAVSNEYIQSFYRENTVHLFLNVSSTEGLPFVLIEAIAMGIPVMATDVGGCREIANENTGVLLPADFDPDKVAAQLDDFYISSMNSVEFRNKVRRFWESNFRADVNYQRFLESLVQSL